MTTLLRLGRLLALACAIGAVPILSNSQAAPSTKPASDAFLFGCEFPASASPEIRKLFWETGSNFARITGGGYGWALDSHKQAMEDLDAHGVKVLLQLGSHYPDSRYFALKDSYFIDQAGETGKEDRSAYAITYSGQAWPQYSYASDTFRTELTKDFTSYLDGLRSCKNIAGLLLHNEPGYFWVEGHIFDYNPQAIARFRKWLSTQHASIAELNNRWSTSYAEFDNVEPPRDVPPVKNIAAWMDWRRFNVALMQEFLQWEAAFAKRVRPDLPCTTNLSGPLDNWYPLRLGDNYRFSSPMDIAGIDIYPTASWSTRFQPGFAMDMSMGVAQGRPVWVAECDVYDASRFPGLSEVQRADMLRSEVWSYIGHGARAVLLWSLGNQDGFALTHGEFNARVGAVREIAHAAQMLNLGGFHRPNRTTAICVDQDAFLYYGGMKPKLEGGGMAQQSVQGLYAAVAEGHYEADIVSADQVRSGAWKRYRAILLATPALMDADLAAQLSSFVAGGGLLISEAPLAGFDRWGRKLDSQPGFGLDRVFGLHVNAEELDQAPSPITTPEGTIAGAGRGRVMLQGAGVIGSFADGRPAVTRNRFGKGMAIFFASDVGLGYSDGGGASSTLGASIASMLSRYSTAAPAVSIAQDSHAFVDTTLLADDRGNRLLVFVSPSERAHSIAPVAGVRVTIDDEDSQLGGFIFPPTTQLNGRTISGPQSLQARKIGAHKCELSLPPISSALPLLIARDSAPLLAIDAPTVAASNSEVYVKATCFNPSPKLVSGTIHLILPPGWAAMGQSPGIRISPHGSVTIALRARVGMGYGRCVVSAALDYTNTDNQAQHIVSVPVDVTYDGKSYHATATITTKALNSVRPWIFGDNIEWVNNGMGFWLPEKNGFDEKLVQELKASSVTHLRYPGGAVSDYFDWSKSTGANRTPQPNPFDNGRPQRPDFGPAEFGALCQRAGIPEMITLNAGTGTPEMAADWVKYCRDKMVRVTGFEVGNEIYMADAKNEQVPSMPIARTPQEYAEFFLRTRALVDSSAPGTKLGAIGLLDTGAFPLTRYPDWMKEILTRIGGKMDFIAIHNGYAPAMRGSGFGPQAARISDDEFAGTLLGASVYVHNNLRATESLISQYGGAGGKKIDIHITEHGPLVYPMGSPHDQEDLLWNRSLIGALYQACLFNVMLRDPKVTSANHLPLCQDVFGALIGIRVSGSNRQTWQTWRNIVFYVFQQYSRMAGRNVMDVRTDCPTYDAKMAGVVPALKMVPCLDVSAYQEHDGRRMSLFLVNRDIERDAVVTLKSPGMRPVSITSLSADSYLAANSPEHPETVVPVVVTDAEQFAGGAVQVPKHSMAVIEFVR